MALLNSKIVGHHVNAPCFKYLHAEQPAITKQTVGFTPMPLFALRRNRACPSKLICSVHEGALPVASTSPLPASNVQGTSYSPPSSAVQYAEEFIEK
ncbi:hypothetical protein GOP47_0031077, partial [Adiantum capillus-veneris]